MTVGPTTGTQRDARAIFEVMEVTELPSELRTLVKRYGTRVLEDADGLRATLDDFLDEGSAPPGDVNLLVDAVRFGSLERLKTLLDQGAEPAAATADVAEALAQRRGGDAESAYWACAVLGYAADLLPGALVPGTWVPPSTQFPPSATATGATSVPVLDQGAEVTNTADETRGTPSDESNLTKQGNGAGVVDPPPDRGEPHDSGPTDGRRAGGQPIGDNDSSNKRQFWPLVAAAAVIAVLLAGVGYFVGTRTSAGNEVPVASVADPDVFGHFGDKLSSALAVCGDASIPGGKYAEYNCKLSDTLNGPFDLRLTANDPQIQTNQEPPRIVIRPPKGTIVTDQQTDQENWHFYYMEYTGSGRVKNDGKDEVNLTLYDVDRTHPGAAIFIAEDSASHPLTQDVASQLLADIGDSKFRLPAPFTDSNLQGFADRFLTDSQKSTSNCRPAFTTFEGEREQTICRDVNITQNFGYLEKDNTAYIRYGRGADRSLRWKDENTRGPLYISQLRGNTRLFWTSENDTGAWGLLSARTQDLGGRRAADGQLLQYFESFYDHPKVTGP